MGYRTWSEAHGAPFPWVGVGFATIPVPLCLFAIFVGVWCSAQ